MNMKQKKALRKDFYMEISKSRGRFLSIFLIVALGVAFLSGIRAAEPDLRYSGDAYFDKWKLMDIQVLGTLGLTDTDVEEIRALDSVEKAEGTYSTDALCDVGDSQKVLHVMALLSDMNLFDVSEGRLPQKADECLVDRDFLDGTDLKIGDTITLESGKEDPLTDTMVTDTFTIVGAGSSCRYISFGRGSSLIGTGEVKGFLAVAPEAFDMEVYTEICVAAAGAYEETSHTEAYDSLVEHTIEEIEDIEGLRCRARYDEITDEAKEKIEDAKKELEDGKKEADEKLAEAEKELEDGEQKLLDGEKQTVDGEVELASGKQTLYSRQEELKSARKQYESGLAEYESGKQELASQEAEFNSRLPAAMQEIEAGEAALAQQETEARSQLDAAKAELEEKMGQIEEAEAALPEVARNLEEARKAQQEAEENHTLDQLKEKQAELLRTQEELAKQLTDAEAGKAELEENRRILQETIHNLEQKVKELQERIEEMEAAQEDAAQLKAELGEVQEQLILLKAQDADLEKGIEKAESGIAMLTEGLTQTKAGLAQAEEGIAKLTALPEQIQQLTEVYDQLTQAIAMKPALNEAQEQLAGKEQEMNAQMQAGKDQLTAARQELTGIRNTLQSAKKRLDVAGRELAQAKSQIDSGQSQIDAGLRTLAESEKKLQDAKREIEESRKKLEDGKKEYEEKKLEAKQEIQDGEEKIQEAEEELSDVKEPSWYVNDRSVLPEYTGYGENADRMRAIGRVFPVLFFLVAALISLTTMTRMVEEQRIQIGTLKALGYNKFSIAGKYLFYALLATIGGSGFGVLFGEKVFPFIIIYAYKIMYKHVPDIVIPYNLEYAAMATAAAILCTSAATLFSCYRELASQPAVLMRPPAPKQGKRILMERIPFIWKRLSFIWKSTFRNLIRYKKRFFMTVIGIGGCMALMLVGFGLKDSIFDIARLQYKEIQTYNGAVYLKENPTEEERTELLDYLKKNRQISGVAEVYMKMLTVQSKNVTKEPYLCVAEDPAELEQFVLFRDRKDHEKVYSLDGDGVILTEKLAKMLDVKAGDTFRIQNSELGDKDVTVSAVCENYMGHYIYMSESLYEKLYGEKAEYNGLYFGMKEYDQQKLYQTGEKLLKYNAVQNVSYTDNMESRLNDMLKTLNLVIIVLIISAGALAFIVLYNLNNINITERRRELATLKVLGFYDKEVAAYVYRENILLTFIGAAAGCIMGWMLHKYVVVTVEIEEVMFGRGIYFQSYIYSLIFTVGFSVIVNLVMYYKLKKIDMVESLKSIE